MIAGPGFMEMLIVMFMGGGFFSGGLLGLPPGERDASLVQCPPKDVVLYSEWSARGKGQPGAAGVDGLAADPEILAFIAAIDKGIHDTIELNATQDEEKILGENIPPLVKIILNRPGCLYLDVDAQAALKAISNPPELPPFTPQFFGMLPAVHATLVINGGDEADTLAKHLEALVGLLPESEQTKDLQHQKFPIPMEGASLTLHRHKNYFILGWGKDTVDNAIKGLTGEAKGLADNPRFTSAMETVLLERTGSVGWFDLKSLIDKAVKGLGPQGLMVAAVAQQLGADSIESLAICSGVVDGQMHSRGFLKTGGKTEGILALAAGRPLAAKDFQNVPADADLVLAFTIDFPKILATTKKLIAGAGEEPKENFDQILTQLEKELGFSFENELFKAFGQTWLLYDSPSNGGVMVTAPILGWEVKDEEVSKAAFEKLMAVLKLALPGEIRPGRFGRGVFLNKKTFLDHEIYYINQVGVEMPFTPAFMLTKTHLLAALSPQHLKAHLRFLNSKEARFSEKFDEKIATAGGELFAVCYSQPELFARYLTSISPMFATVMFGEMQRQMPGWDSFEFPSARALLPYVGEGLLTKERTKDGILFNNRQGLPVPGLTSVMTIMPMLGWMSMVRVRAIRAMPANAPAIQLNQHQPKLPTNPQARQKIVRTSAT